MDIPDGYQTDHIGSNPLNNSVLNLRLCNGTLDNARGNYNTLQEHNSIGVSMKPIIKIDNLEGGVCVPVLWYEKFYSISNKGRVISEERHVTGRNGIPYRKKRFLMRTNCSGVKRENVKLMDNNGNIRTSFFCL